MDIISWIPLVSVAVGVILGATVLKGAGPAAGRLALKVRFWLRHGRKGKKVLFVYSDSSNWKLYIEKNILPRIADRSIVLNWSKPREWGSRMQLETAVFNQLAGSGKFVPVAILTSPLGKDRIFRLWHISGDPKHGKAGLSKDAERAFLETLKP